MIMNLQFPQGRMNTRKLVKRCPHCGKYPVKMKLKYHLRICEKNPANKSD